MTTTTRKSPRKGASPSTVLILRTCNPDMTSYGGFKWPAKGLVAAPDWSTAPSCGGGLHGFLWGEGDGSLANWDEKAKWLVVEADAASVIDLQGKVKFPKGRVVYCGDRLAATSYIAAKRLGAIIGGTATTGDGGTTATAGARGTATAGYLGTATAGDRGTATAGDRGTATAGDRGTATAGARGTATAGYLGTATAGFGGTATAGDGGTATAGYLGTATAGYLGTATAGDRGTATAGELGTATAGDHGTATAGVGGTATAGVGGTATAGELGTATAGDHGTATAGVGGTATAGDGGTLIIKWWDGSRYRLAIAYVGEGGILPNTLYHHAKGQFVKGKRGT